LLIHAEMDFGGSVTVREGRRLEEASGFVEVLLLAVESVGPMSWMGIGGSAIWATEGTARRALATLIPIRLRKTTTI